MNVSACLVTRGNVDMQPIIDSLPPEWEKIVWDNSGPVVTMFAPFDSLPGPDRMEKLMSVSPGTRDLSVYGRYAAIEHATGDLIYVQDDDVIVSDPQAIVGAWVDESARYGDVTVDGRTAHVVCNMPSEFRHDFYREHALVGFGAAFHRDAPARAFGRWFGTDTGYLITRDMLAFNRCCDVVFTALTPRVLVDVPKTNLPYATGDDRMYRQDGHVGERKRMLELALKVRDGR